MGFVGVPGLWPASGLARAGSHLCEFEKVPVRLIPAFSAWAGFVLTCPSLCALSPRRRDGSVAGLLPSLATAPILPGRAASAVLGQALAVLGIAL